MHDLPAVKFTGIWYQSNAILVPNAEKLKLQCLRVYRKKNSGYNGYLTCYYSFVEIVADRRLR